MSEITEEMWSRVEKECIRLQNVSIKEGSETVEAPSWLFGDMLRLMDGASFVGMINYMKELGIIEDDA